MVSQGMLLLQNFSAKGRIVTKWYLSGTTAVAALLSASAALADITPEEIWQNWQDLSAGYGQTMTAASAERDGDTLVVTDLSIVQDQDDAVVDITIAEVLFADNGDGTVNITMSDSYVMKVEVPATPGIEGATASAFTIAVDQPGMLTTVSGTTAETTYAVEAPTVGIKLESVEVAGLEPADVAFEATLSTVLGTYLVAGPADDKRIDVDFGTETFAMSVQAKDPETQNDLQMIGTIADLAVSYGVDLGGLSLVGVNFSEALKAGTAISGGFTHGAFDFVIDVTDVAGPSKIAATATGGGVNLSMDASGVDYSVDGTGTTVTMSGPEIPFPEFKLSYQEIAMNLSMPLLASPDLRDFAILTRIVDLSVSDELWGMLDPAGNLPHDPATLVVDAKGKVVLTTDLLDEAAMAALGEGAPGEFHALDVTELRAKVAGAELTGAGAFTFDNTDLVTFDGMPTPTGKLDLKLVGGNVLLDKLVAMGLVTEDDANGARLMISMFANPGATPDELTSTLEFKDKGFYANGQRLQ